MMTDSTEQSQTNDDAGAGSPAGRFRTLRAVADRSVGNSRSTVALIRRRSARRRPAFPVIAWQMPALIVATLIVICFLVLDEPAAAFRGQWAGSVGRLATQMTDIGLGVWYLVPAILALIVANQIDWNRFSGQRLLLLYNWTILAAYALVSVGGALLLSNIVKNIIGRARPTHYADHGVYAFDPFTGDASWASFPSGHSSTVGAVVGVLALLVPWSRWVVIPFGMWLVATRIVVGAHHPSDVVAGFAFGFVVSVLAAIGFARFGYLFAKVREGLPRVKTSFLLLPRRRGRNQTRKPFQP